MNSILANLTPNAINALQNAGIHDDIVAIEATNAALLKALRTIQVVNAGDGPLKREIIEQRCDEAIRKASQ